MKEKYLNIRIADALKADVVALSGATRLQISAIIEAALEAVIEAYKRDGMIAAPFSIYSKALEDKGRQTPGADRRKDAPGKKPRRRERPNAPHGPQIDQPVRERSA